MGQSSDSIHHNAQDTDPSLVTLCFCTRGRLISTGSTSCHCSCMHVKCAAGYVTAGCRRSRLKCGLGVRPYSTKGCSKRTCCRPRNPRDRAATRAAVGTRADRRPLACQSQSSDARRSAFGSSASLYSAPARSTASSRFPVGGGTAEASGRRDMTTCSVQRCRPLCALSLARDTRALSGLGCLTP